ncbi:PP2C family protein-serine/threonine phosphatase [Streptomyces sp. NPDC058486]|uniref:PP2C family protein-serine/threonine phosphatase n=1 Tax=unclassified Streptomyces TaxID=2593676 RepID=UPI00365683BA
MDRIGRRWPAYAAYVPWALLVVAMALESATPPWVSASPLLALACVAAGVMTSLRQTLWIALIAVAFELGSALGSAGLLEPHEAVEAAFLVIAVLVGVDVNRLLQRYGSRLQTVTRVAEAAQRAVLPPPPPMVAGFRIASFYRAAQAETQVGGDIYAVQETPFGLRVFVGDVRGKGLGAVSTVALLLAAFRDAADEEETLPGVAARLDRSLEREGRRRGGIDGIEGFTTGVLAEFPYGSERVRVVNRGHPSPYVVDGTGTRTLHPGEFGLPLGMAELGPGPEAAVDSYVFPPGSNLLLVTDGVTEARGADGVFFSPRRALRDGVHGGPDEVLRTLLGRLDRWSGGGAADDTTVVVMARALP